ncbi:hypothetical protein SELMODRAFT_80859 [Selaginella moellendorffii]|uniref:Pentacotripeptide-repeat region of PRORP domain-containing protein n=1 Tax=Selaginella moellendorffii TaxID=88036 RepID=D8QXN7_SELML|nr:hypothetical protein SELMODRAFT_80859 [Selaginella moellendorffii]
MLTAYTFYGNGSKALEVYDKMVGQLIQPDSMVLLNVIDAESLVRDVGLVRNLHACVASSSFILKIQIQNALINMYAQCGSLEEARQVFDGTERKNLVAHDMVTWSSLLAGYTHHGHAEYAILLHHDMHLEGVQPDSITYISILNAQPCRPARPHKIVFKYFKLMFQYGIVSTIVHYNCMVDILGRANHMEDALFMIYNISFDADLIISWMTLLGACRKWLDISIGKKAFAALIKRPNPG